MTDTPDLTRRDCMWAVTFMLALSGVAFWVGWARSDEADPGRYLLGVLAFALLGSAFVAFLCAVGSGLSRSPAPMHQDDPPQ